MAKLNQIIAIEKGTKARVYAEESALHKILQKPALFVGLSKTFNAIDADGEQLPPERQKVQYKVEEILNRIRRGSTELMDLTARKDWTNCTAKGDVIVDGETIIAGAPVSFLLFMEKQLNDFRTMIVELPVTDVAEDWTLDTNAGLYKTSDLKQHRTKKVQKPLVLYPATPEHPAQTQLTTEDVISGYWTTVKQSGGMTQPHKDDLLERVVKLSQAVKEAREAANVQEEVSTPKIGDPVYDYLLGE